MVKRSTCCMNIKLFFKHKAEKKVVKSPDTLGATVTHCMNEKQQLAIFLQNEMSQATTVCDSWEIKVIRLTMEVAEQSTQAIGRNTRVAHSSTIIMNGMWASPQRQKKLIPTVVIRRTQSVGHIPSTSIAVSDTRSASVKTQFLESLCPQRNDNRISSSSLDQRMVSRNCFGIWCGRTGPLKIHMRQR